MMATGDARKRRPPGISGDGGSPFLPFPNLARGRKPAGGDRIASPSGSVCEREGESKIEERD